MPWLAERFSAVDADNDGRITRDECRDAHRRLSSEQL
jgi:Ca2+-binding EF-hand superfamily protein